MTSNAFITKDYNVQDTTLYIIALINIIKLYH